MLTTSASVKAVFPKSAERTAVARRRAATLGRSPRWRRGLAGTSPRPTWRYRGLRQPPSPSTSGSFDTRPVATSRSGSSVRGCRWHLRGTRASGRGRHRVHRLDRPSERILRGSTLSPTARKAACSPGPAPDSSVEWHPEQEGPLRSPVRSRTRSDSPPAGTHARDRSDGDLAALRLAVSSVDGPIPRPGTRGNGRPASRVGSGQEDDTAPLR
jgi:hypothetical protein